MLKLPAENKGNSLRGGFGSAFRRLVCVPQCQDPRRCPLDGNCPYWAIFEPAPPPGADRLSRNQDAPRPFVFRPPLEAKSTYQVDELFEFGLTLLGKAVQFLPYFVLSFREVCGQGFGLNRAVCELERVDARAMDGKVTAEVYSAGCQVFKNPTPLALSDWVEQRTREIGTNRLIVRFLTPTALKFEERVVRQPEFHHLFKRVRDRLNALCTFYGPGPIDADFKGLGEAAERVRTVRSDIRWVDRYRTSSKTHRRHELSGFVGECTYEGDLFEFLPWLAAGELIHVGKHTAWGNGWYQLSIT